jgi:filamentous hemagglutinin family protein
MSMLGLCLGLVVFTTGLRANPTGGNVAAGSAAIAGQGTSAVTINQASNIAIINWQSFSIGSGESTTFLQPSAASAALNRVLGGQTSVINGTLTANGQVYLINGNGIIVGPGGVISANAFTASTRDISDADFLAGNLHFTGASNAGVQNLGKITAIGGDVILIGKTVDNQGTINAPNGTAGLIAGDDVLLAQKNADGSTIMVSPTAAATSASGQVGVHNSGTITAAAAELKAANGNIYALAIQNSGIIRATTVLKQGGHIWLTSDAGTVSNSGTLDASATAAGGKGGSVSLKSTNGTVSHTGQIIAQGGLGGTGGDAEISGANVQFTGLVDLTAPGGTLGTLLIDPNKITVVTGGGSSLTGSMIDPSAIVTALNGATVTLSATTSITVTNAINASTNANAGNLILNTVTDDLNAAITLKGSSALSGSATTVNVGAGGLVQNAIDASSTTSTPTINLASGATYGLTSEVLITKSLTLNGNGAILDGSNGAGPGNGVTRVLEIDGTASGDTVNVSNLTLENGNGNGVNDSGSGGGLLVYCNATTATVTISDSTISGNSATGEGGGLLVGAAGTTATVTITDSTISGNMAGDGGGIFNKSGAVTISDSTISGNMAGDGGGIFNQSGAVTISDSTISGNMAGDGGGIWDAFPGAKMTISDSTISGNSAAAGGGIMILGGPLTISDSTISDNLATGDGGGIDIVGNVAKYGNPTVTISDTILAGNSGNGVESDYENNSGTLIDDGYNLYGQNGSAGGFPGAGTGDLELSGAITTALASLGNYGGPTQTMALVVGSPAYLAGGPVGSVTTDQRGVARGSTISIGAYDVAPSLLSTVVNTTADTAQDIIGGATTTLRDAIYYANVGALSDPTITFDPTVFASPETITLAQGELLINSSLSVDGPAAGVTINAHTASRVMEIDGTASGDTVNVSNLTLENGNGNGVNDSGSGGGLLVYTNNTTATVTIIDSTISGNTATGSYGSGFNSGGNGSGGGVENSGSGTVTIIDSTISGNSATGGYANDNLGGSGSGGGIDNSGTGAVTITASTISGNSATGGGARFYGYIGVGGGIDNEGSGTVTINTSTLSGNSAAGGGGSSINGNGSGGGIDNTGSGTVTVTNSTLSGNSATGGGSSFYSGPGVGGGIANSGTVNIGDTILAANLAGGGESDYATSGTPTLTDNGYNLYGQNGNAGGFTPGGGVTTDIKVAGAIGTVLNTTLANNGGPTQTLALVPGSKAIAKGGPNVGGFELDQRDLARPLTGQISIGAYEANSAGNPFVITSKNDQSSIVIGTLRTALAYSNANPLIDPTITFSSLFTTAQTITLAQGELIINSSLSIDGPSVGVVISGNNASRVMEIDGTVAGDTVNLNNLTLENGNGNGVKLSDDGGGLLVDAVNGTTANVTITDSTISGNSVTGASSASTGASAYGGGIYDTATGMVTINDSTISGNSATGGNATDPNNESDSGGTASGGGIDNAGSGTVTISDSTLSGNTATGGGVGVGEGSGTGYGGGIENAGTGTVTISDSTLSGNAAYAGGTNNGVSANAYGGGVNNVAGATVTIENSTISGNVANGSTIGNSAPRYGYGGGIFNVGTVTIGDTILAGNTVTGRNAGESDYAIGGTPTLTDDGYNLYGQSGSDGGFNSGNGVTTAATDIELQGAISSVLSPLSNYGGPTETMALVVGSPAIDVGDPALIGTSDQRGIIRGSSSAGTGTAADIGAYEAAIIDVTAKNQSFTYGQSPPTLTYKVTSGPTGQLTGSVALITPETNAGTYTGDIGQGTLALTNNTYLLDFTAGTLTINQALLTITANSTSKTYGDTVTFAGTEFTDSGLLNSDAVTSVTLTSNGAAATATVGNSPYNIKASQAVGSGLGNYAITYVDGTLTVNQALLTITANSTSKTYGDTVTFAGTEFTDSGLLNSDAVTSVTLTSNGAAATANVQNSPYDIKIKGAQGSGLGNYQITYVDGSLTVNQALLTITANSTSKTYGDTVTFAGTEFTDSGLLNSDTVTSVTLTSPGAAATATVGNSPYDIKIKGAQGSGLGNYQITYVDGSLTVNQALLTITADSTSKAYGDTVTFAGTEFTDSGLLNSDTVTSVTLTSPGAAATATVGNSPYDIKIKGAQGSGLGNYQITYVDGSLTVNQALLTITADSTSKTYGDTVTFAGTEFTDSGLLNSDAVTSVALTSNGAAATANVNNSPYDIKIKGAQGSGLGNYQITYVDGSLTVNQALLTITADSTSKTYGDTVTFAGTEFTDSGLLNSDAVTSVTLTSPGAAATVNVNNSPYDIKIKDAQGSGLGNYQITYVDGSLTVTQALLTITADSTSKTYGDTVTFAGTEFTDSGLLNSDTVTSVTLTSPGAAATADVNNSPYDIKIKDAKGSGLNNYQITYVDGSLTVNPAPLTIIADDESKTYGQTFKFDSKNNQNADFTISGTLYNGDEVDSVTLDSNGAKSSANVKRSPYKIKVEDAEGSGLNNYTITYDDGSLTINPATLTYVANPVTINLGQPIPLLTGTVTGFVNKKHATRGILVFTTLASDSGPGGSYAIDGSGLKATHHNYIFVQAPGNATALTINGFLFGQPGTPFFDFAGQFDVNAGDTEFFTQSWFPLFDASFDGQLIPVFSPGHGLHPVYSTHGGKQTGKGKSPAGVIAFGSSFTVNG